MLVIDSSSGCRIKLHMSTRLQPSDFDFTAALRWEFSLLFNIATYFLHKNEAKGAACLLCYEVSIFFNTFFNSDFNLTSDRKSYAGFLFPVNCKIRSEMLTKPTLKIKKIIASVSVRDILHKNLNMVWIQHIKGLLHLRHKKSNIYSLIHGLTPPPQYIFIYILLHSKTLTVQDSTDRKYKLFLSSFGALEVAWLRGGFQIIINLIIFTHFLLWLFQPPH